MGSSPRKINFYHLPRPVQERFAATTRRRAPPAPLLSAPASRKAAWVSLGASAVLVVLAVALFEAGWGDASSPLALHGGKMLAVDGALVAAVSYGVVRAAGILRALDTLPWRPGTYLFPASLIEATSARMRVWAVADAEAVERVSEPVSGLALRMRDGSRVVIPASRVEAEKAVASLASVREEFAQAIADEDPHVLAELDPLHDRALSSPIGPTESMRPAVPVAKRFDWVIALLVGAAVGPALATMRNRSSDEAMYRSVVESSTADGFRRYLAQGGQHSGDVRDLLLPRAELREARAQGTVEAIEAFVASHPGSKIGPEVDAALRHAMLGELEKARQVGTVTALDELARKHPGHKVGPELDAARHALYLAALAGWRKAARPDPASDAFMQRLVASAEKIGPACAVRFRLEPSRSVNDADRSVQKHPLYPGPDALPSKYVSASALRPYEDRVGQAVAEAFAGVFPADVLLVRAGEPLDADAPAPAGVPALVVDYTLEWARANTVCQKPSTVFAGWVIEFGARFGVPEGAPLALSVKAWRGAETWKVRRDVPREEFEAKVYDVLIGGAFDQLQKKLLSTLF